MISDNLYERAFEFKKTKLWKVLWNDLFFAVKLSDHRIGYIRMTGESREIYALELYIGEKGLESLRTLIKADHFQLESFAYQESSLQRDCLQCALVGKTALSEEEREEVKAFARSHAIKISGKNAYLRFMKFQPYYYPWRLLTEKEQETLCEALDAVIEMSKLLDGKSPQELGLNRVDSDTKEIVLLERQGDTYVLGKIELLPEEEKKWPMPELFNDINIAKLKKVRHSGIWECGLVRIFKPVQDEREEVPLFPILLFAINSVTRYILPVPLVVHYEDNPNELMNLLIETLLEENICPKEIWVKDSRTYAFFKPFCEKLKITIKEEGYLPALAETEDAFYSEFGLDAEPEFDEEFGLSGDMEDNEYADLTEEEAMQNLTELLDLFLEYKEWHQYELPKKTLNQLAFMLEKKELPKDLEEKLSRLFESVDIDNTLVKGVKSKNTGRPKLESVSARMAKEAKGKSYVISVSLGTGCYRHIQISCNAFLLELHNAILGAFGFQDDHAHAFFMDNKIWSNNDSYYMEEAADDFRTTNRYRLSQTGLCKGTKFKYLFDFGDEWMFQCKVLRVVDNVTEKPIVIQSKGEAPEQYPDWDDEWDDK